MTNTKKIKKRIRLSHKIMFSLVIFLSFFCSHKFSAHIFIFCMLMQFFPSRLFPCSALAFPNVAVRVSCKSARAQASSLVH